MRASLIKKALFLILIIFFLHKVAGIFYWYTSIVWFDMVMHFLGGVFLALVAGSLGGSLLKNASKTKIFAVVLLFVFVVGIGWEVFEFSVQEIIKIRGLADIPDSFSDLFFDLIGGIVGTFFVISAKNKYTSIHNG